MTRGPHPAAPSFAGVAAVYERARPGYAAEAISYLVAELDLRPGRVVLDLGAGTGKLARQLLPSGARVIAVEPLAEMRALVPPGIEVHEGTAEAIPLPDDSVDAVTVAQALHWFDEERALAEIRRVLRPGGRLAIVSNRREASAGSDGGEAAVARPENRVAEGDPGPFDELLARHRAHPPLEAPPQGRAFPHVHRVESFAELASTESSIASLDDERRAAALADFARLGGGELRYVTYVEIVERLQPG